MSEPNRNEWAELYQAAIVFKQALPWEWMENEDLFAVENPQDGEVGYCSVLSAGGVEFGLAICLGEVGYERYSKLVKEEVEPR